jgi:lipopolysaccharide biosynthesis protein
MVTVLAFYLPQYHPIPENDKWWGKGFTEWTNTVKAKPLFPGHKQPHLPSDLGFYDLRVPETRIAQAELARNHGIDGFIYWHYWLGNGKQLLERPFNEVVQTGKPDFPFCLAWANHSWIGKLHGLKDNLLFKQKYPGMEDHTAHFFTLVNAFRDIRYIKINNKPLFIIYYPEEIPETTKFLDLWQELAMQNGFNGMYFIAIRNKIGKDSNEGFEGQTVHQPAHYISIFEKNLYSRGIGFCKRHTLGVLPFIMNYKTLISGYDFKDFPQNTFIPTVIPNWDSTPRLNTKGWVFHKSTPELFKTHFENAFKFVAEQNNVHKMIFIKSWNEWAEGNYLEPDMEWGKGYLNAIKEVISPHSVSENEESMR